MANDFSKITIDGTTYNVKVPNKLKFGSKEFDGSSEKTITASDLGLSNALHFIGETTTALSDGSNTSSIQIGSTTHTATTGDVVLYESKEFVWQGSVWKELGDGSSHALKTISISAGGGLTGGGTLEANRTISHADTSSQASVSASGRRYITGVTLDGYGHVTGLTTGTETVTAPTVNNGTLTIQKNGTNVQTFTANQSGNVTANITVPTKTSDLTNDSGFTTNTGTITGIKMNGSSKGTSGVVDLGTVLTNASAFATSAQGTKADNAMPKSGGTFTGEVKFGSTENFQGYYIKRMIGSLGAGTRYADLDSSYKDGTWYRMWRLRFPSDSSFWGKIKITLYGGYSSFNASGVMSKSITCNFNTSNIYNNVGCYDGLGVNVEQDFRISEAIWNATASAWEVLIWQKNLNGNNSPTIMLECWTTNNTNYIKAFNGIAAQPVELTQSTSYSAQKASPTGGTKTVEWATLPVYENPLGEEIATMSDLSNKANLVGGNTFSGVQTINAPTNVEGSETTTLKAKTSNGGAIIFGKEGPNSGTMIRLDQADGTCRLRFRSSATAGAMVWEQPEQGAQLYVDLGKDGSDKHRVSFPSSGGTLALTSQVNAKYTKPSGGIPKTDLASAVQTSLGKADTALQSHQDISGKANLAGGNTFSGQQIFQNSNSGAVAECVMNNSAWDSFTVRNISDNTQKTAISNGYVWCQDTDSIYSQFKATGIYYGNDNNGSDCNLLFPEIPNGQSLEKTIATTDQIPTFTLSGTTLTITLP